MPYAATAGIATQARTLHAFGSGGRPRPEPRHRQDSLARAPLRCRDSPVLRFPEPIVRFDSAGIGLPSFGELIGGRTLGASGTVERAAANLQAAVRARGGDRDVQLRAGGRGLKMDRTDDAGPSTAGRASSEALGLLLNQQLQCPDLVVGLVEGIGATWEPVHRTFAKCLRKFEYAAKTTHVVRLLDDLEYQPHGPLPGRDVPDYYDKPMNAGNQLRLYTKSGASVAALAARKIALHRRRRPNGDEVVAYSLRSLTRDTRSSRLINREIVI